MSVINNREEDLHHVLVKKVDIYLFRADTLDILQNTNVVVCLLKTINIWN